jgi:transporter family protein
MRGDNMIWLSFAILSAVFAGLTSILAKCGIKKTDSDLATAIRTIVVLAFSWIMVFIVGSYSAITEISKTSLIFLILSGLATGASWIFYFKALSIGDINKVVPIDKSSTILTVLLAIICFGETSNLAVKLIATAILAAGIFLMVEKKKSDGKKEHVSWMLYAILSAVFAALTSILAKFGISGIESNLGTAIRTGVVLVMAWIIVFAKGKHKQIKTIEKKELLFIGFSGIATGASWLCYYYAIQNGIVSVVVPIDKMSILVTVVFSYFVFKEKLSKKAFIGLCMMVMGTLLMVFFK